MLNFSPLHWFYLKPPVSCEELKLLAAIQAFEVLKAGCQKYGMLDSVSCREKPVISEYVCWETFGKGTQKNQTCLS